MSDLPPGFVPDQPAAAGDLPPGFVPDEDPRMAKLRATQARVAALKAEPDPTSPGEIAKAVGSSLYDRGASLARGLKAIAGHPIATFTEPARRRELERGVDDAVTLGYGRRLADHVSAVIDPLLGRQPTSFAATEEADRAAAPDARAGASALSMFLPTPMGKMIGGVGKGIGKVVGPSTTVAGQAARGALQAGGTYAATAPVVAALHADAEGHRLEAARDAATDPGGLLLSTALGGAAGAGKQLVAGAPARAAESEIGALTEGVKNVSRVQKFAPNEADIRSELAADPEARAIRAQIKSNPVAAEPVVAKKLGGIASADLQPFYDRLEALGPQGQLPVEDVTNTLKAVRSGLNRVTEKGQIAAIDDAMKSLEEVAAENGGRLPAQFVRETASSFQGQGHANVPMFGQVPLNKALKQDVGNALRGAVADHLESLAPTDESGKALGDAFRAANKRVATWYRIHDLVDEKATRERAHAPAMADMVREGLHAVRHPVQALLLKGAPAAANAVDRSLLGPLVDSDAGQALSPVANSFARTLPIMPVTTALTRARRRNTQEDRP